MQCAKNKPILLCFSAKYKTVTVGFLYVVLGQSVTKNPFVPLFSFVFSVCVCGFHQVLCGP